MIPDVRALRFGDRSPQFDSQVRNALRGIEDARVYQCTGRARVDAQGALAALIESGRVRVEVEARHDAGKEQPRPLVAIDQTAVLAYPSQPGVLRVDTLLHGMLVDEDRGVEGIRLLLTHPR